MFFQLLSHCSSSASFFLITSPPPPPPHLYSLKAQEVVLFLVCLFVFCMILPSPLRCLFTPTLMKLFAPKVNLLRVLMKLIARFTCSFTSRLCTHRIPFTLANLGPFCSFSETYSFQVFQSYPQCHPRAFSLVQDQCTLMTPILPQLCPLLLILSLVLVLYDVWAYNPCPHRFLYSTLSLFLEAIALIKINFLIILFWGRKFSNFVINIV